MNKLQFKDKWVLVTGASSGLGYEMARQLAHQHKANLILLARRRDRLEALKQQLEAEAGIKAEVITADLSRLEDVDRAIDTILAGNKLYAAILNAGITYFGRHSALQWNEFETMLQTNVVGVVRFTNRLVAHFEKNQQEAGIMVVSSMAALFPVPYQAAYSGTKAFVLSFVTALAQELSNPNLSLTVYTPGGIVSEMTSNDKFNDLQSWLMPVEQAAREGLNGFIRRKLTCVPGFMNRLGSVFMRFVPRGFMLKQMSKVYLKSLVKSESFNEGAR